MIAYNYIVFTTCWVLFKTLYININSFNSHNSIIWILLLPHLTDGQIEAQNSKVTSQISKVDELGFEPRSDSEFKVACLSLPSHPQRLTPLVASRPLFFLGPEFAPTESGHPPASVSSTVHRSKTPPNTCFCVTPWRRGAVLRGGAYFARTHPLQCLALAF